MIKSVIDKKQEEIKHLDTATQEIVKRIDKNNNRLLISGFITLAILLSVGVIGIYYQNRLATDSKDHIDCIIKDLSTPLPPGSKSKYIDYQTRLTSDCKIKFSQ